MKTLSNETTTQKRERSLSQHHEIKKEVETVMSDHQELTIFKRLLHQHLERLRPSLPPHYPCIPIFCWLSDDGIAIYISSEHLFSSSAKTLGLKTCKGAAEDLKKTSFIYMYNFFSFFFCESLKTEIRIESGEEKEGVRVTIFIFNALGKTELSLSVCEQRDTVFLSSSQGQQGSLPGLDFQVEKDDS